MPNVIVISIFNSLFIRFNANTHMKPQHKPKKRPPIVKESNINSFSFTISSYQDRIVLYEKESVELYVKYQFQYW